jgi:hypothetical protein
MVNFSVKRDSPMLRVYQLAAAVVTKAAPGSENTRGTGKREKGNARARR